MRYLKKRIDDLILRSIRPSPLCDFCGSVSPAYVYAASRMSTGVVATCWRWTACEICSVFIDTDNWHQIEDRLLEKIKPVLRYVPTALLREVVHLALSEFHQYAIREGP
jgi:hypothetical protein